MKRIIDFSKIIYNRIGFQEYLKTKNYVPSIYAIKEKINEKSLIYNTLTREMILLESDNEYENNVSYLVRHWFLMDANIDQYSMCYTVKKIYCQETKKKSIDKICNYTIMTTTNCNARCKYCYESGIKKVNMSESIAIDVANFIKKTTVGNVNIQWFGGEPLYNGKVIDIISESLKKENIIYSSGMSSNGYLFNEHNIKKIRNLWNLERAQITLDGTEKIYNETKRFIYPEDKNPYKRVIDNIKILASNGIYVNIRLNLSKNNISNIHELIEQLKNEFCNFKNVFLYSRPLVNVYNSLSETDTNEIRESYIKVEKHIANTGKRRLFSLNSLQNSYCIADNMRSVVITPEGGIGLCEHYSDSELIGDIYHDEFDYNIIKSWQQQLNIPECKKCPMFPQCFIIRKCPMGKCTEQKRMHLDFRVRNAMQNAYKKWEKNNEANSDI